MGPAETEQARWGGPKDESGKVNPVAWSVPRTPGGMAEVLPHDWFWEAELTEVTLHNEEPAKKGQRKPLHQLTAEAARIRHNLGAPPVEAIERRHLNGAITHEPIRQEPKDWGLLLVGPHPDRHPLETGPPRPARRPISNESPFVSRPLQRMALLSPTSAPKTGWVFVTPGA